MNGAKRSGVSKKKKKKLKKKKKIQKQQMAELVPSVTVFTGFLGAGKSLYKPY